MKNSNKDSEETIAGEQTPTIDWPKKDKDGFIWND